MSYDTNNDTYTQPLILSALEARLPPSSYILITDDDEIDSFLGSVWKEEERKEVHRGELRGSTEGSHDSDRDGNGRNDGIVNDNCNDKDKAASPPMQKKKNNNNKKKILQIRGYESIDFELAYQSASAGSGLRETKVDGEGGGDSDAYSDEIGCSCCCCLVNAYMIRKALIRKHFLARCVEIAAVKSKDRGPRKEDSEEKKPPFRLQEHFPLTVDFELDYAEFLDEALIEAYELKKSFEKNDKLRTEIRAETETDMEDERDWWILKPSMGDGGQGLRLFSSEEELRAIFDEWEEEEEDEEEEKDSNENDKDDSGPEEKPEDNVPDGNVTSNNNSFNNKSPSIFNSNSIITSQLRHFIAQKYIKEPLLFPNLFGLSNHKFHIRTYVIACGSLKVYVYKPMLALFAQKQYEKPRRNNNINDLAAQLTNTCLNPNDGAMSDFENLNQDNAPKYDLTNKIAGSKKQRVKLFWSLPDTIPGPSGKHSFSTETTPGKWKSNAFAQICGITGSVFEAAAREMMVHFQTMPNAFEIFGMDFLLDKNGHAWLMEVNAFPDFKQTGEELKDLVAGLFESVVDVAIKPFFGMASISKDVDDDGRDIFSENTDVKCVLDIDLGRR